MKVCDWLILPFFSQRSSVRLLMPKLLAAVVRSRAYQV